MADKKISALPVRSVTYSTDEVPILADGQNWRTPLSSMMGVQAMVTAPITFFTAREEDGPTTGEDWDGGPGLVTVYGTWGTPGALVQLAYSPDGGTTFISTDGGLFNNDSSLLVSYPSGKVRASISNAGGGTSLTAKLESTR